MKQNYLSALVLTAAVMLCSCSISEIEPIEKPKEREEIESQTEVGGPQKMMAQSDADSLNFDQVKALLDQMGYNTETLTEYNEYYLIYSDLIFYKYDIIQALNQPITRARTLQSENHRLFFRQITFDPAVDYALRSALDDWNNIGNTSINLQSSVHGHINLNRAEVNIYVEPNQDVSNKLFTIDDFAFPYKIRINTKHGLWETIKNSLQLQYLLEHAIGHIVGLDHSADYGSIMQDESGLAQNIHLYWSGLSDNDKYNVQQKYPLKAPVTGYTINPNAQAGADKRIKLEFNQVYTVTPSYTYAWVTDPKFTYQVVSGSAVITPSDKSFTIKLDKQGVCTVRITAKDAMGETHPDGMPYEFDLTFYSLDIPAFSYPPSIEVGQEAEFRVLFNPLGYTNVTYKMTASETKFDDGSGKNVTIQQSPTSPVFKVKLKEYGDYLLTTTVNYDNHSSVFEHRIEKYYRPDSIITKWESAVPNPYILPSGPSYPPTPTGPNQIYQDNMKIVFGNTPTIPYRIAFRLTTSDSHLVLHLPGRPDRWKDNVKVSLIKLNAGASSTYICPVQYGRYDKDSVNYQYHYAIIHPNISMEYLNDVNKPGAVSHK